MKLVVLAGLVVAGVLVAGFGRPVTAPVPAATAGTGAGPASGPATTTSARAGGLGGSGTAGSDGLTVRYRHRDGGIRTLGVEDFPR